VKLPKVADTSSIAYFGLEAAQAFGQSEAGFYTLTDSVSADTEYKDAHGDEISVPNQTNPTLVQRVYPAADGVWFVDTPEEAFVAESGGGA
jgi:hypothetical protein